MQVSSTNTFLERGPVAFSPRRLKGNVSYQAPFCAEQNVQPDEKKEKPDSKFGIKTATNVIGVAAWLLLVGYSIKNLKMLQKKHPETMLRDLKDVKKIAKSYMENSGAKGQTIEGALEGNKNKGIIKTFFNIGDKFQNAKMKVGSELFTNLLYAFGTLVVLPTVVLLSPSKKGTTNEDKFFTVLRQPLSVAATLGLQFTFDKLIDKNVPEAMKQNKLEDASILDKDGKIIVKDKKGNVLLDNIKKIKYNVDSAKEGFKETVSHILNKDELKDITELKSFEDDAVESYERKFRDVINDKYSKLGVNLEELSQKGSKASFLEKLKSVNPLEAKNMDEAFTKFETMTQVVHNNKKTLQNCKTFTNVVFASIIGCTFLNVVYGKTMKALKKAKSDKTKNNEAKEVK